MLRDRAPAKINLTLHIRGRRADGFHALESLVVFAGVADHLAFFPREDLAIAVEGPFGGAAGPEADNLVLRATRNLAALVPGLRMGRFSLKKRIPVAAGLGGGSSDAAAGLRLLARANGLDPADPRLSEAAAATGSDVTVCLEPRAAMMLGRGETVDRPFRLPAAPAVLVNPRIAVATAPVFKKLGLSPGESLRTEPHPEVPDAISGTELRDLLAACGNDLEPPACALEPGVAAAIAAIRAEPLARLVRMSGSGATVFALTESRSDAVALARALRNAHPGWWIVPTLLR